MATSKMPSTGGVQLLLALMFFAFQTGSDGSAIQCTQSALLDLQIIVDSSGSIGKKHFYEMMNDIAEKVVSQFEIGQKKTRVALFKYSRYQVMKNEFPLNRFNKLIDLKEQLKKTKYEPGWTMTAMAMKKSLKLFKQTQRKDAKVAKICLLFTDGNANDHDKVPAAAKLWAADGATVFAIGIGQGINWPGLIDIAGSKKRAIQVKTFHEIGKIAKKLLGEVCKVLLPPRPWPRPPPKPATKAPKVAPTKAPKVEAPICATSKKMDIQLIVDSSGSVGKKHFDEQMGGLALLFTQFEIGKDHTRFALYRFAFPFNSKSIYRLNSFTDLVSLQKATKATPYKTGPTYTAYAMEESLKLFKQNSRKEAAKVCMVFTDGLATDKSKLESARNLWEKEGIKVYAVGLGKYVSKKDLALITGDDKRVLLSKDFSKLAETMKPLLKTIC